MHNPVWNCRASVIVHGVSQADRVQRGASDDLAAELTPGAAVAAGTLLLLRPGLPSSSCILQPPGVLLVGQGAWIPRHAASNVAVLIAIVLLLLLVAVAAAEHPSVVVTIFTLLILVVGETLEIVTIALRVVGSFCVLRVFVRRFRGRLIRVDVEVLPLLG